MNGSAEDVARALADRQSFILTSHARPAARIVSETGAGRVYTDTDVEGLAGEIIALASAETRRAHGAAGRHAVVERYHWEVDAGRMLADVELLQRRAG